MGILNLTPDSFSHDGLYLKNDDVAQKALRLAQKMIKEGADMIDIGGESTRPGSHELSVKEEVQRIIPTLKILSKRINVPISVDTYKSEVAKHALDEGCSIINNIMGVKGNKQLLKMVKSYDAAIVLMHIKGTPHNMQNRIFYQDLIPEIYQSLKESIENCLEIGIKSDKIIIDPGIGFGKTVDDNLAIINRLGEFTKLHQPILVGTSRKSFIGKVLNREVHERLMGTAATVTASILHGAHIVRVHDVRLIKDTVDMTDAIKYPSFQKNCNI